jgi:CPA1 family monovalent cation:H+ antiporter
VIFATLVLQGLTLRPLIQWLRIQTDGQEHREEQEARLRINASIIEHIEENYALLNDDVLNQIKTKYEIRIQRIRKDQSERKLNEEQLQELLRIQQELVRLERGHILRMRREARISDEVLRKLEYELDLEETRLLLEQQ